MKDFSLVLFAFLALVWVYLLWAGRINQWGLISLFVVTSLFSVAFYRIDEISKIGLKGKTLELLLELSKIREDIYAKASEVQKMGEETAELLAYQLSRLHRLASTTEDLDRKLVDGRNRISEMLKALGSQEERVQEIIAPIENAVAHDLARTVHAEILEKAKGKADERRKLADEIEERLKRAVPGNAEKDLHPFLEEHDLWSSSVRSKIRDYDRFRTTGTLPN